MIILLLTGTPGGGKTTIVMGVAKELKERGIKVGGVVSKEVRINNVRTGFEFIDLATNDRNVLASVTKMVQGSENISLTCRMPICCLPSDER
jgi:nucleoside-triphosphatase